MTLAFRARLTRERVCRSTAATIVRVGHHWSSATISTGAAASRSKCQSVGV